MTIIEALRDSELFGRVRAFSDLTSWEAWLVNLSALFGLPMDDHQFEIYRRHTGNQRRPTNPYRRAWQIIGRRGGKSIMSALVAVFIACFRSYEDVLASGERGTVMVIAADRRQARVVFGYIAAIIDAVPMLSRMVTARTKETIQLSNRVNIEVHTASFRSVRGYTIIAAILDEVAFWPCEDSANPAEEILAAIGPGMSTVPNPLMMGISSPYSRRGPLWEARKRYWGQDAGVLVWQASTEDMNPTVDPQVIKDAYEADEAAASAEFGAQFRRDIEGFVSKEAVEACVVPGRLELPPLSENRYVGFIDPSGGRSDSMTLAIAHREKNRVILDAVRERKPPFSPDDVVQEFSELLNSYRVWTVFSDRYGGEWVVERFRKHGVRCEPAKKVRSALYLDALPLLNSGLVDLLDHPRLINQLCSLERRTARSGKDTIDHSPNAHDDVCNAVAGALVTAIKGREKGDLGISIGPPNEEEMAELARRWPNDFGPDVDRRPLPPPRHAIQKMISTCGGVPVPEHAKAGCGKCIREYDQGLALEEVQ